MDIYMIVLCFHSKLTTLRFSSVNNYDLCSPTCDIDQQVPTVILQNGEEIFIWHFTFFIIGNGDIMTYTNISFLKYQLNINFSNIVIARL